MLFSGVAMRIWKGLLLALVLGSCVAKKIAISERTPEVEDKPKAEVKLSLEQEQQMVQPIKELMELLEAYKPYAGYYQVKEPEYLNLIQRGAGVSETQVREFILSPEFDQILSDVQKSRDQDSQQSLQLTSEALTSERTSSETSTDVQADAETGGFVKGLKDFFTGSDPLSGAIMLASLGAIDIAGNIVNYRNKTGATSNAQNKRNFVVNFSWNLVVMMLGATQLYCHSNCQDSEALLSAISIPILLIESALTLNSARMYYSESYMKSFPDSAKKTFHLTDAEYKVKLDALTAQRTRVEQIDILRRKLNKAQVQADLQKKQTVSSELTPDQSKLLASLTKDLKPNAKYVESVNIGGTPKIKVDLNPEAVKIVNELHVVEIGNYKKVAQKELDMRIVRNEKIAKPSKKVGGGMFGLGVISSIFGMKEVIDTIAHISSLSLTDAGDTNPDFTTPVILQIAIGMKAKEILDIKQN